MPVASRGPRNTIWIIGGLVLLLASGLAGLAVARSLAARTDVLVTARAITAGETIDEGDLITAEMAVDPVVTYAGPDQLPELVGQTAVGPLAKGAVVNADQFAPGDGAEIDQVILGVDLAAGQYPRVGLKPGDRVTLIEVYDPRFNDDRASTAGPLGGGEVVEITRLSQQDHLLVSIRIPESLAVEVSQMAHEQRVRLVLEDVALSRVEAQPVDPVEPLEPATPDVGLDADGQSSGSAGAGG
jgi:hypothetical protein